MIQSRRIKIGILIGFSALTVAIHYGWVLENIFGHSEWVHALHSRFCYLPIMIAAAWFGLRGGVLAATAISVAIMPYLWGAVASNPDHVTHLSEEFTEIFFYYTIGVLIGLLVDREMLVRRRHEQTQLELERSQRLSLVGQMAAGVAHEIKNPLASIKGAVEILSDESTSRPERKEFQEIVAGEIKRIDGTIREFLEFARPKQAKLVPLDLSATLQTSLRQLQRQVTDSGITLQSHIDSGVTVQGDQEKIHQVVLNLVLNAVEASDPGSSIDVSLKRNGIRGVHLKVRDHGKGIEQADLERVFEPFFSTKVNGTGLGLAIVKAIVDNHHGTISVTKAGGEGTEITLSFPSVPIPAETAWR